jgi:hypothetical protein
MDTAGVEVTVDVMPPPVMVMGMLTVWPAAPVTFPVTRIAGKLCPADSPSLRVQVKPGGVPLMVHVQPVPATPVIVKFVGGSVTVTVPLLAAAPAALDTVIE